MTLNPALLIRAAGGLAMILAVGLSWSACPAETASPSCQETLCGGDLPSSRCFGNFQATCAADGAAWSLSTCGIYACNNGACATTVACTKLGSGSCNTTAQVKICFEDGSREEDVDCGAGEVCAGGACVPSACTEGQTRCGDGYTVLTCTGGAWVEQACEGGEICLESAGPGFACVPRVCEPLTARCDAGDSLVCDHRGASEKRTACGVTEVCRDGFCQPKVCGAEDPADAGVTDEGGVDVGSDQGAVDVVVEEAKSDAYVPPLQQISKVEFTLAGKRESFEYNASAVYVVGDKNLKILAGGSFGKKIEINVAPIEPYVVGKWNESDGSEVGVQICYYDGSAGRNGEPPAQVEPCTIGFSHASIAYIVDLTDNNGPGSRIIGTFSATLKDALGDNIELTDGAFNVRHK